MLRVVLNDVRMTDFLENTGFMLYGFVILGAECLLRDTLNRESLGWVDFACGFKNFPVAALT